MNVFGILLSAARMFDTTDGSVNALCRDCLLPVVCITGGYVTSYWNRPFFPEWCSDDDFDDTATYDTMVRIAGSWSGLALAFKAVVDMYGWTHIVVTSNDKKNTCWYGVKPFGDVFDSDKNYTYTWLKMANRPTDKQLENILQHIRARTRGFRRFYPYMLSEKNLILNQSSIITEDRT